MQNEKRNTRKLLKDIFWYDKCLCKLFFADDVEHTLQDFNMKLQQALLQLEIGAFPQGRSCFYFTVSNHGIIACHEGIIIRRRVTLIRKRTVIVAANRQKNTASFSPPWKPSTDDTSIKGGPVICKNPRNMRRIKRAGAAYGVTTAISDTWHCPPPNKSCTAWQAASAQPLVSA